MLIRILITILVLSAGNLALAQNTFPSSGNAGVGISTPQSLLHLYGNTTSPWIRMEKGSSTKETGTVFMTAGRVDFYFYTDNSTESPLQIQAWGLSGESDSYPRIRLPRTNRDIYLGLSGGNVGVGTTTPNATLSVMRGIANGGTAQFNGTTHASHFNYSTDEDTYIRGGKENSKVIINDSNGGFVGVGTSSPAAKLHLVGGDLLLQNQSGSGYPALWLKNVSGNNTVRLDYNSLIGTGDKFYLRAGDSNDLVLNDVGGNVGIGTSSPDAKLTVKGDIHAERVKVDLNIPAPDYVFEEDYDLRSLDETANYIKENKHLPEVPSAKEIEVDGIDLGEMNMLLLKKVEELTLHMIEKDNEVKLLNKRLQAIEDLIKEK